MQRATFDSTAENRAQIEMLVRCDWLLERQSDPSVRVVEVDENAQQYDADHIPGAVTIDWRTELQDPIRRDIVCRTDFEALMGRNGIGNDTIVVFYGDVGNVYAAHALWLFTLHGHRHVRLLDGGRSEWQKLGGAWSRERVSHPPAVYRAARPDLSIRAFRDEVFRQMEAGGALIDARSPAEYRGEAPERAQRGGHIPGARNIPWSQVTNEDGTFKSPAQLGALCHDAHLRPDEKVITYSGTGEHSGHIWFVLRCLLGFPHVKQYDGSWAEWGNLVGAPIER